MAISFCRREHIKRSAGKNMLVKAAYSGKLKLQFEGNSLRKAEEFDFTRERSSVISHSVLLPEYVDSRFKNPEVLWNEVEKGEKRKDAQVGSEVVLALPDDKCISNQQRIELAETFAKTYFVSKGYGVQVNVHPPSQKKSYDSEMNENEVNESNFHAHILITPRHFSQDGKSFSPKKLNDLDPEVRGKTHFSYGGFEWHKIWTQFQNEYFERNGLDLRVDSNSVISQIHLGPLRMRSESSYKFLALEEKRDELRKDLLCDPNVILTCLLENKSVFTEADFEVIIQKNILEKELSAVRKEFWSNPDLIQLYDKESKLPLKLYTSAKVLDEERQILRLSDRMYDRQAYSTKINGELKNLNFEQKLAFEKITEGRGLSCIEGFAGTGKSYLLCALKDHYENHGYRVRAFGPDNATVKVLKEKGFTDVTNVHKFLYKNHFSKTDQITKGHEVWIIDEAGKLGTPPLLELMKSAEKNKIQVIFSGDSSQFNSVERGGMFKLFSDRYGHAALVEIQRQQKLEDRDISKRLATGDVAVAIDKIAATGGFIWSKTADENLLRTVEKWAEDRIHFPYASHIIIAHTNDEVRKLNDLVHAVRQARGEVQETEFECRTINGNIRVSEGDLIEIRATNKQMKVNNGDVGVLISAKKNEFTLSIGDRKVSFNPEKFTSFQLGYATTYYRSQGATVDYAYMVYHKQMSQKFIYVGKTRHVRKALCFVSKTDASNLMDIKRQVSRASKGDNTLNYYSLNEIEKMEKNRQKEKTVQDLCGSDSLLAQAKGYGFRAWDYVKTGIGSVIEDARDIRSDKGFYAFIADESKSKGHVVEVKEEIISSNSLPSITSDVKREMLEKKGKVKSSSGNNGFRNLPEEKKLLFVDYFEKSKKTSCLYSIVQSETQGGAIAKESTSSYKAWQEACIDRNKAAYELVKGNTQHLAILGQQSKLILRDRAAHYEDSIQPRDSVENQLKNNIDGLLYRLFPDGPQRKDSKGFRFGSKGSLSVSCVGEHRGSYYDHENSEGGGMIKLIEKKLGFSREGAISWAREFLAESGGKPIPTHFSTKSFIPSKQDDWISLMPPEGATLPKLGSLSHYLESNYKLTAIYPYNNIKGELVCFTIRLEDKEGKKIVLPVSYGKNHPEAPPGWSLKAHSEKKNLLYNGQKLSLNPKKPVLIVEGEKTADAAGKLLGKDYVVISWMGGSGAAKEVNWGHLVARDVVIWPDNDSSGFKASSDIEKCLRRVGVNSLRVVNKDTLKDLPTKWDLADPLPGEKDINFIQNSILRAENKAIGINRLEVIASQHGLSLKQLNEVVCNVDDRLRPELEKKHGSKTWETEASILNETSKILQDRRIAGDRLLNNEKANKSIDKTQGPTISLGCNYE